MNNTEKQLLKRIETLEARGRPLHTERTLIDIDAVLAHLSSERRAQFEEDFEAVCKDYGFTGKEDMLSQYEAEGPAFIDTHSKIAKCIGDWAALSY